MSANEELEEHVHHAEGPFDRMVAATMAIIAALLAVVTVLGQHYNTEELLLQGQASDQWAYSQAKDIRHYVAEATRDTLLELKQGARSAAKYDDAAKKYKNDTAGIQDKAREFEHERDRAGRRANRFHFGEIFLEVAIVFSSLAILSKTRYLFYAGAISATAGVLLAVSVLLI